MAMKIDDIARILDEMAFKYRRHDDTSIAFFMTMDVFVDPDSSQKSLLLVAQLMEDGEYFQMYAPAAFRVRGEHQDAFLRACAMIQWRTKLIQFEWDETDGEVRPVIEFPLEDGRITLQQFRRCVGGMVSLMDQYYPVLKRAAEEGIVAMEPSHPAAPDGGLLDRIKAAAGGDLPDEALARRLEELAEELRRARSGGAPTEL